MKHFLSIADATDAELANILDLAIEMRHQRGAGQANAAVLSGKSLAMIFEKPSLRTRASFEQAVVELGGHAINLQGAEVGIGKRESAADVACVLNGMVNGVAARVFEHQTLSDLTCHSSVPVINLLSDRSHPCQALADAMTIMDEFGRDVRDRTLAFVGDGNNVARSVAFVCGKLGMKFVLSSPRGYELDDGFVEELAGHVPAMSFSLTHDPVEAVKHADVVYTDTWVSMGQESEMQKRCKDFEGYQINSQLLAAAPEHAIVLHCLPAHRGFEITHDVIDGPRSRVFPEAHNRLHAQKGLLAVLLGDGGGS